jgi:hypothetical protein
MVVIIFAEGYYERVKVAIESLTLLQKKLN